MQEWDNVPFAPGSVRAVSYNAANKTIATQTLTTAGAAKALRLSFKDGVGAAGIAAGCNDVALVKVEVVDSKGQVVPTASHAVTLTVSGSGATFLGGGNGDPAEHTPDKSTMRPAFGGLLLGVYASTSTVGTSTVTAAAPGLQGATLDIKTIEAGAPNAWCPQHPGL